MCFIDVVYALGPLSIKTAKLVKDEKKKIKMNGRENQRHEWMKQCDDGLKKKEKERLMCN